MRPWSTLSILAALAASAGGAREAGAYPIDEYDRTGIRRLQVQHEASLGLRRGRKLVPGALWPGKYLELRMRKVGRDYELTPETSKDPALQAALETVLKKWAWRRYNVTIVDISDPAHPRYAGVNDHQRQTPGSVAKVLVAAAVFEQLRARFPDDIAARERLLKTTLVSADDWAQSDSHEVPVVTGDKLENVAIRRVRTGDTFSLWEWMDHALSPSNNSAAATLWREATLMKLLGDKYPPAEYGPKLWAELGKDALTEASFAVIDEPLRAAGLDPETLKLRLYFTKGAGKYIRSQGADGTPFGFAQWLVRVEQGRMVDEWSSLELKKMLYLTRRRVRYLHTHTLDNYAAFFKSGSLYRFTADAPRIQYEGDLLNVLNSLIEIDTTQPPELILPPPPPAPATPAPPATPAAPATPATPATPAPPATPAKAPATSAVPAKSAPSGSPAPAVDAVTAAAPKTTERPFVYIVSVMSNELKRNASMDHARLAEAIHAIVTATPEAPAAIPDSPDLVKVPDIKQPTGEPDEEETMGTQD